MAHPEDEHPSVVMADISRRPEIKSQVLVFANEKGGVGKTTLAFHTAIALQRAGHRVLTIDLDRRQQSLKHAMENREATIRSLGVDLPCPNHIVLEHQTGAMLAQEIARIGSKCNVIIIDVPGHDSPIARRAIAIADKLVTPLNPTYLDLDAVARFNPATMKYNGPSRFSKTVSDIAKARVELNLVPTDWMMVKNRVRPAEKKQLELFHAAIRQLPDNMDVRLSEGLIERVAYRELFLFGLIHADCADLPGMGSMGAHTQELNNFLKDLDLAQTVTPASKKQSKDRVRPPARAMGAYRKALHNQLGTKSKSKRLA